MIRSTPATGPQQSQRGDQPDFTTPTNPQIPGACYTVVEVDGRQPAAFTDFTRVTAMTLMKNGQTRRVIGSGTQTPGSVRLHQKDTAPDGKDVRVWTITRRR